MAQTIQLQDYVTVGALAEKLSIPVTRLITELMKNGVMATVNERIDFDTAQIIINELGLDVELAKQEDEAQHIVRTREQRRGISDLAVPRPPIVAVMGHVDHGKTSLLDSIRGANVVKQEAGGITQHISAYQIMHNGRAITFLDTPGHEAFSAVREHSARLTDLAVIVVAADDGVKPQTVEAIRFARQASVKIIVAINKIDKPESDVNRVKQQLSENNLLVEEWGGDTVVVEVSAKTGTGITNLLDMILLIADVEDLRADVDVPATGLVIEAHNDQKRGPIAHVLVEEGTLKRGDYVVAGSAFARVRNLETSEGETVLHAGPSMPVVVIGFRTLPEFGDEFKVLSTEKEAKNIAEAALLQQRNTSGRLDLHSSSDLLKFINRSTQLQTLNIIVKADVGGSLTSVLDSLKVLDTDEVAVRVVGSGIGTITENDVYLAHTSGSLIYGFNVTVPSNIKRIAGRDKVSIRSFSVIYELIDDARAELSQLLSPEIIETDLGTLKVKAIFKTTKSEVICGGEVTKGKLTIPSLGRIVRDKKQLAEVEVTNLKRGPQDVKEVLEKELCGLSFKTQTKLELQEGDTIEVFRRETKQRKL
jgi:translation initiation factor IF-2